MTYFDINGNAVTLSGNSFWNNKINYPYWILYLDCGRKYFSVANVKTLIDAMASAGMNQLTLHFSENEGFRFELDDMTITANSITYDLTPCLGGSESSSSWYTQIDMDEIISYAHSKGIDVVPALNMPGHMGRILSVFTQFKLSDTTTLNIKSTEAVNFAKAIVSKYAGYFSSRGCHWYNMGYDEIMGWATGFPQFYSNGDFQYVVDFANALSEIIKNCGMIPRAFNEVFHYANDFDYFVNRDIECLYWDGSITGETLATPSTLQNLGYTLINSNEKYYWVLNSARQVTAEYLASADLLKGFDVESTPRNGYGAQFCVWCDNPTSYQSGDGGTGVVTAITPLISAFGTAITSALTTL